MDSLPSSPTHRPHQVRMLDYACGPGLASRSLFSSISSLRGIDVSAGMVTEFNRVASDVDLYPERMHAVQADISTDPPDTAIAGQEWYGFDLALMSMALHHVADPKLVVARLVDRLKPGGVLVIVDRILNKDEDQEKRVGNGSEGGHHHGNDHGGHGHGHGHTHDQHPAAHTMGSSAHGFEKAQVESFLLDAGCDEAELVPLNKPMKVPETVSKTGEMHCFIARGRKRNLKL